MNFKFLGKTFALFYYTKISPKLTIKSKLHVFKFSRNALCSERKISFSLSLQLNTYSLRYKIITITFCLTFMSQMYPKLNSSLYLFQRKMFSD